MPNYYIVITKLLVFWVLHNPYPIFVFLLRIKSRLEIQTEKEGGEIMNQKQDQGQSQDQDQTQKDQDQPVYHDINQGEMGQTEEDKSTKEEGTK